MRLVGFLILFVALLSTTIAVRAEASAPQVGDTYNITMHRVSERQSNRGSSGSANDNDAIVERVTGLRADGVELEYDEPEGTTADEKFITWQLPARVFKPFHGPMQLLNGPELEARRDAWLKAAGLTQAACGHWYFTWNAFQVVCDPQSAIKMIEAFDLGAPDLRDGASYQDADASGPGILKRKKVGQDGSILTVEMTVDPDKVRHTRAESDVVVGEIMKKPVTLDEALSKRTAEAVSGTITVTFETQSAGSMQRRVKLTKLDIKEPDGRSETETVTETLERRLISRHN